MTTIAVKPNKITTSMVVLSVVVFVSLLLTIPYYLTQISAQNSTQLNASYLVDDSFNLDLESVVALPADSWQKVNKFNLGLNSQPHWLKLSIPSNQLATERLFLLNYGLLDNVDIWFLSSAKEGNEILSAYMTGDAFVYDHRFMKFEQFLFPLPNVDDEISVYMRVRTSGPVKVPIELWDESSFIEYSAVYKLFIGVFFGFMIAMSLSNLMIYASNRNAIFLIYTGYITCIAMVVASLHGVGFHYIWPNSPWLQEFAVPIFANLTMIFIISLTIHLLDLSKNSPGIFKLLLKVRWIFVALLTLCLFAPYAIMIKTVLVLLVISVPIIFSAGFLLAIKGSVVALYFCGAWGVLLLSGVSISLENFGLFKSPIDSTYLLMVGAIAEALLLALALAFSFSEQLLKAKETREIALKNEQEALDARDELLALQDKNQTELEYSIEERTFELEMALKELAEKNQDLERLSAIDPLTNLMNRRYFDKRILAESRRSKRELTPLGVAMLDIDHFKKINDNYGHLCGDHCLKVFADVLKEYVKRPSDVVCRYGGEEFVLVLPNTDEDGVRKLLEKVRYAVEHKKIMFEGQEVPMTVSIGACSRVIASEDEHVLLIAFVDKKLYEAKNAGRNQVIVESY